ncbi:MAG: hypothetical protein GYB65_22925 [Chloroflexi bacterium]|nr:hypothetical protein [Chloroflexota bacterium]
MTENDLRWLDTVVERLRAGESEAVIAEVQHALERDRTAIQPLLTLALAHSYQGQGALAEPYARQAMDVLAARARADRDPVWYPRYLDMAYLALFDAMVIQGRFQEGARLLHPYIKRSPRTNMLCILTAWGHFLAGDKEAARAAFQRLVPSPRDRHLAGPDDERLAVSPKLFLMYRYMSIQVEPNELFRIAQHVTMYHLTGELAAWEDEARRNAHNPYGQRLADIVDGLRALLERDLHDVGRDLLRFAPKKRGLRPDETG